jgi:hypothetical protein
MELFFQKEKEGGAIDLLYLWRIGVHAFCCFCEN